MAEADALQWAETLKQFLSGEGAPVANELVTEGHGGVAIAISLANTPADVVCRFDDGVIALGVSSHSVMTFNLAQPLLPGTYAGSPGAMPLIAKLVAIALETYTMEKADSL